MILVGGYTPGPFSDGPYDDAWEMRFDDATWHLIPPGEASLPVWTSPSAAYDSRRHRELLFENDWLWALDLDAQQHRRRDLALDTAVPGPPSAGAFSLGLAGPNPFWDRLVADVGLDGDALAELTLFDITGRRVMNMTVDPGAGKRQHITAEIGTRLRPGVYMLRLRQERQIRTLRIVHAH
jgi:hypothetical protein